MSTKRFAVFDIDGTIVRTGMFLAILDEMVARSIINKSDQLKLAKAHRDYLHRKTAFAFDTYTDTAVAIIRKNLANLKVSAYKSVVVAVVKKSVDRTYTYPVKLIKQLKAKRYTLLAISGSEETAVAHFCKKHGFDDWVANQYKHDGLYFTGEIANVVKQKQVHLKQLIDKHGLSLKGSLAVGDTASDISMLAMVENPICFNPSKQLKEHAQKAGWLIVVERKNVVYQLQPKNGAFVLKK